MFPKSEVGSSGSKEPPPLPLACFVTAAMVSSTALYDEVTQFRKACGEAHLKTILATGELGSLTNVYKASLVAMMAGKLRVFRPAAHWVDGFRRNKEKTSIWMVLQVLPSSSFQRAEMRFVNGDFGPLSTFLLVCSIFLLLRSPYVAVDGALVSKLPFVLVDSSSVCAGEDLV